MDRQTPPQGTLNNDAANTGGGTVSLVDQGTGIPGAPTTGNRGPGRNRVPLLIIGAIILALIGGGLIAWSQLSGSPDPTPTPTPATTPSASTPQNTPSPTPTLTAEQAAIQGATAGYTRHHSVVIAMYKGGGKDESALASVASDGQLRIDQVGAKTYRERKIRHDGTDRIVWTKATSVGSPNASGVITDVTITACVDTSNTFVLDAAGKRLPKASTNRGLREEFLMRLIGGTWKAINGANEGVKTC